MKAEGSPSEFGPSMAVDAMSGEGQCDDHLTDDEPETELEALQQLPPDERRKALRRLRNRESARRVRARRLQEMSVMETTVGTLQEDNAALKAHVSKLQNHIQSMTLKIYEVTAKYEAAVAENAQLRGELQRTRRTSNYGDSSFMATSAGPLAGPAGGGGADLEASPFVAPAPGPAPAPHSAPLGRQDSVGQLGPLGQLGQLGCLSAGHVQLRSSSPMDITQQKQALEEVVALLEAHKRRNQGAAAKDRSGGSDKASSAPGAHGHVANNHTAKPTSPALDAAMQGSATLLNNAGFGSQLTYNGSGKLPIGSGAASAAGFGTGASAGPVSHLQYHGSGGTLVTQQLGAISLHPRPMALDVHPLTGGGQPVRSDTPMAQLQQMPVFGVQGVEGVSGGAGMCHHGLASTGQLPGLGQLQQQFGCTVQQGLSLGGASFSLLAQQQLAQQQQQILLQQQLSAVQGQGHFSYLQQQQPSFQPQTFQPQACHLQPGNSGALYSGASAVSAAFYSASSAFQQQHLGVGTGGGAGGLQVPGGGLLGSLAGAEPGAAGGGGCAQQGGCRSGSLPLVEHTACAAGSNVVALHAPTAAWHGGGGGAAGLSLSMGMGLTHLQSDHITDELFKSLDEYVPQDL